MATVANITLDTSLMQEYARYLKQAPQIVLDEIATSMTEALLLLTREIKERLPVGVTGLLRGSVTHSIVTRIRGVEMAGKVYSPVSHAVPVELGTKPHFPPLEPLRDWVEKKLGVSKKESRGVAFLVARKIAAKGTAPQKDFETGFRENQAQVNSIFERGIERIRARLMGVK